MFALQISEQAGPAHENPARKGHEILTGEAFATALLEKLQACRRRVEENWESSKAVWTFTMLAARLLALGPVESRKPCLEYLAECRGTCVRWLTTLQDKAAENTERAACLEKCIEIALVCLSTFDVEREFLPALLAESGVDFLRCLIRVQETQSKCHSDDITLGILMLRAKRLARRALPIIVENLDDNRRILDGAVGHAWQSDQPWELDAKCWVSNQAQADQGAVLHLNLLTGELLVDGRPLDRLPSEYELHADYGLFGSRRLEVMPSTQPGFAFAARSPMAGHDICLGLSPSSLDNDDRDLLLRATKGRAVYDLVPSRVFAKRLPFSFGHEFVHFFDHQDRSVEFRPKTDPWTSRPASWRLKEHGGSWRVFRSDSEALIDPLSPTAGNVAAVFRPLEDIYNMHISHHATRHEVNIHLPRLNLGFDVEMGSTLVRSRQFRGMCVSASQDVGTLIGLRNKLLLSNQGDSLPRMMLTPEGVVSCKDMHIGEISHVAVEVDSVKRIQSYHIDNHLGRLVGNSLQSKLYLAHLHALTSLHLPDTLTGMTGTEQALKILQGGEVTSFRFLESENVATLCSIANLTPKRRYLGPKSPWVQVTAWKSDGPGPLAQHPGLYKAVKSLFKQAAKTRFLYPQSHVKIPDLNMGDARLLQRHAIRVGSEMFTDQHDQEHGLKANSNTTRRENALRVCLVMAEGKGEMISSHESVNQATARVRKALMGSGSAITRGGAALLPDSEFRYDSRWLKDASQFLPELMLRIHMTFRSGDHRINPFDLQMWMATIAFAKNAHDTITQTLLGIVSVEAVKSILPPDHRSYDLSHGLKPKVTDVRSALADACVDFEESNEAKLPARPRETGGAAIARRKEAFKKHRKEAIQEFAARVNTGWPNQETHVHKNASYIRYFRFDHASKSLRKIFDVCEKNGHMDVYLRRIAKALRCTKVLETALPAPWNIRRPPYVPRQVPRVVTVARALERVEALDITGGEPAALAELLLAPTQTTINTQLSDLLSKVSARAETEQQSSYVNELRESVSLLGSRIQGYQLVKTEQGLLGTLESHLLSCAEHFSDLWRKFERLAGRRPLGSPSLSCMDLVVSSYSWPRVTVTNVLEQLNQQNRSGLSEPLKRNIVNLGKSLAELQQAERLLQLANNNDDLVKEIQNQRPRTWCPLQHPDCLLLEIESGIRIRPVQEEIAALMQDPPGGGNAVLQLNMGEGKSSVIVPMVAAYVADGKRLVRVIVARPQELQMDEILVSKLGGMLGRRVFHLPFARTTKVGDNEAKVIERICTECSHRGGVLLVQPEHLLSFQQTAISNSIDENGKASEWGQSLLKTLAFFDKHSQDVVDESDYIFSPKFELVYTKGRQGPISFSPYRWLLIHEVLSMVPMFAQQVRREMPLAIEVDDQHRDRLPRVRLLSEEAGVKLNGLIAAHVCRVGISGLAIGRQPHSAKDAILRYITEREVDFSVIDKVQRSFGTKSTKHALLLLRGLLAGRVLAHALGSKRWTVDFGLDRNRQPVTRLAVPYRAKNVPSSASEFSHPDLKIILTSLCYYYGGLSEEELLLTLEHVSQSDHARSEYSSWTAGTSLSEAYRTLDGLNLKDGTCSGQVFSCLAFSKGAIDYFLSRIVFQKEVKEFPSRLAASGWDLGRAKCHPTTGFSGTKDTCHLLPLEMRQIKAPNQGHTNALVLSNMLAASNRVVLLSELGHTGPCCGRQLIETIIGLEPAVGVILDVGAQVLEMSNEQAAKAWLELTEGDSETEAAVFCDDKDEFVVIDRQGSMEPLKTSPFARKLDLCLVFVDQARCFGTDLPFPAAARAAVTLGAKTTKDKLAQACSRLRKLGAGQSVVFCVPQEIEMRIRGGQLRLGSGPIEASDVLDHAISETWDDCKQSIGLWASQGTRFEKQRILWEQARDDDGLRMSHDLARNFLEDEARTLESLYQPDYVEPPSIGDVPSRNQAQIVQRCQRFQHVPAQTASLDEQEEQERELAVELDFEKESKIERVDEAIAADHRQSAKVREFIESGCLPASGAGFLWAFQALEKTSAATHFDVRKFPRQLRCTHDFATTLKEEAQTDAYQRGVQFVLISYKEERREQVVMVLVSPLEVEKLFATIQASEHVLLRLYAPRQNQSYSPLNLDLRYHVGKAPSNHPIPRDLVIQLNLFAGQLYFGCFQEYVDVCDYLCLSWGDASGVGAAADGFVEPSRRVRSHRGMTNFAESPVQFLKVLMAKIRGNGNASIEKTHVGKMLNGVILTEDDFERRPKRKAESQLTRDEVKAEEAVAEQGQGLFIGAPETDVKPGRNRR